MARRQQPPAQPGIPPEAYLAAAGGALGARAAGEPPEPPDKAARAALILLILARVAEYVKRARARRLQVIRERIASAAGAEADIAEVLELESAAETAYAEKQKARIRRELEKIAAIPDPRERAEAVRRLMRQERRIDRQRDEMSAARSYAAVQRLDMRRQSPAGAYWRLGVREQHCPVCLFLAGRFWPWEVLDQVHPPVHPNCGCQLYGLGSAIAMGLMTAGDIPDKADAIRMAAGVVLNEEEVAELQLDLLLESDAGRLMEAAFGTFKWDPGLHPRDNLGQFVSTIAKLNISAAGGKTKAVQLGEKTRVGRDKDGTWRVVRSGGIIKGFQTPQDAALDAVNRTLKSEGLPAFTESGKSKKFKDFDAFLKAGGHGDPNDAWLSRVPVGPGGSQGGAGYASKGTIQLEIDRLNAEIAELSLVGDKYEQRRLPTLKKRSANLEKKLKKAPDSPGGLPPVDAPPKPEEHLKAEGFAVGDKVKIQTGVNAASTVYEVTGWDDVTGKVTMTHAGVTYKNPPHILTKVEGGAPPKINALQAQTMLGKMDPGAVYEFTTGAGQQITVLRSVDEDSYAIKQGGWEDSTEGWSTGQSLSAASQWVASYKAHSPMTWEGGSKAPLGDTSGHPPAESPLVAQAKKDHPVAYAQIADSLTNQGLNTVKKWTVGGEEWSVWKFEDPKETTYSYSVKKVGAGQQAQVFSGFGGGTVSPRQSAAAFLANKGAEGAGEVYTPQAGMPTAAVAGTKPPSHPLAPSQLEPDASWDKLPTGSALGSKLTQLQKSNFALLSSTEKSAIGSYTGSGYNAINGQLREKAGVGSAAVEEKIAAMDSAFEKMEGMPEDVLIWRGISSSSAEDVSKNYKAAPVGSIIRDNGFISSSTDESMGTGWAGSVVLKIRWPKGAKGLWVSAGGEHALSNQGSGEREMILPRGIGFKIVAKRQLTPSKVLLAVEPISGHRG